ncbi:phosphotransferase family protein [Nonomuraea ferruginea]
MLPTAHDMAREWRVISALAPTPVPVPGPVAFCADEDVIGAPFYLMEYVEGAAVRGREELGDLPPEGTRRLSERLAEVLAAIHAVDYREAGLDGFGRPDGYLARQVERWCKQWERSKTEERPDFDRLAERLRRRVPAHSDGTLVHGDYRLDNTLVRLGPEPEIRAVVDWEMSTLGDPPRRPRAHAHVLAGRRGRGTGRDPGRRGRDGRARLPERRRVRRPLREGLRPRHRRTGLLRRAGQLQARGHRGGYPRPLPPG